MDFAQLLDNFGSLNFAEADGERGYKSVRKRGNPQMLTEAAKLWARVIRGDDYAKLLVKEAMTTSDFPYLTGQILERTVLTGYAEVPVSWPAYCKRGTLRDLTRSAQRISVDRGASVLDGPIIPNSYGASGSSSTGVKELSAYPYAKRADRAFTVSLNKFGRKMSFSWEMFLADDLDAIKDTPMQFGRAARQTEEHVATSLFVSSTGPNATFFSSGNGNILAANSGLSTAINAPLTVASLQAALVQMNTQRDLDGEPIAISGAILVVPPALDITARNIVNATQLWMNDQGGTVSSGNASLQRLITDNWARGIVKPVVNYWLPVINTTSPNTQWYLFANPNSGRPAVEVDFLRAHESPEIFMKSSNQVSVGGGNADAMNGDFDSDEIEYKVRHCVGGGLLDPKMALSSNGTGS